MSRLKAFIPWAALITAFTAGGAWALQGQRIGTLERDKMDRTEAAVRDSLVMRELRSIRATTDSVQSRVSAMYCADKPPGCR